MRRSQRGGVMVQALVVIAGLLALMATLAAQQRVTLNETQNRLRSRRAEVAARSAVAVALASLQTANSNRVSLADDWALLGDEGNTAFTQGDATYRLQIIDAGARIDVNSVTEAQLQRLPITQEQLDSLLDWREGSRQARTDGAKDEYYNALPQAYNARLGRLATLSELLLIRGWTAQALLEPQTDVLSTALTPEDEDGDPLPLIALLTADSGMPGTRADGTARVNVNRPGLNPAVFTPFGVTPLQAAQLAARAPFTSFRALLSQPGLPANAVSRLLDGVTFSAAPRIQGRINVNTASQAVLETIPEITPDIASAIVARQTTGLSSLGELSTIPGLSGTALAQAADALGVGSDTWIIRAYGESGGVGVAIEAIAALRNGSIRIQTYDRLTNPGIPDWWRWQETPTATMEPGANL